MIIVIILVVIMIIMNTAVYSVVEQLGSWRQQKQSRQNKYKTLSLAWIVIIVNTNPLALDSSQGNNQD